MLKKRHRLTVAAFNEAFKRGRRYHGTLVQLIHAPGEAFHGAAVVGKKVHKRAVDRNKLRRRMYAVVYQLHTKGQLHGVYICIAKPAARTASYQAIKTEITTLLAQTTSNR